MIYLLKKWQRNDLWSDLILIFLLAFVVRAAFTFVIRPMTIGPANPAEIDPDQFGIRAMGILEGQGFSNADTGEPEVGRDPLYSFFIAGVWLLTGQHQEIIQIINALLGGLAAALTYLLAYYSFGRSAGWGAGLLYSFFPLNIWYVPLYRYEALSTPLLALSGVLYLCLREHLGWLETILMGVVLGVATLTQTVLLMPLVLSLASLTSPRRWQLLGRVVVATLIIGAVISPWVLRNYIVTGGEFIIVRGGGTHVFLFGNYAVTHHDQAPLQLTALRELARVDNQALILENTGAATVDEVDPALVEEILRQEVMRFLKTQPDQFVWKIIVQSVRFWYMGDTPSKSIFILCLQLPVLIMTLWGVIQAVHQQKPFLLYLLTITYFNLIYAAISVEARYSGPLEPYLMTLASYGLLSLAPILNPIKHFRLVLRY